MRLKPQQTYQDMKEDHVWFYFRQSFEAFLLARHFNAEDERLDFVVTGEDRKEWAKMAKTYSKQFDWDVNK